MIKPTPNLLISALCLLLWTSAGATPLHDAVEANDVKRAEEILSAHPDWVDAVDDEGETGLLEAAEDGHLEMVALLLKRGARLNHQDEDGETALMEAAGESKVECVRLLLNKGAAVGILDNEMRTASQRTKDESILQLLRGRGAH